MESVSGKARAIGDCPNCSVALTEAQVLIEYERGESPSVFVDCRRCGDVVHPV